MQANAPTFGVLAWEIKGWNIIEDIYSLRPVIAEKKACRLQRRRCVDYYKEE